MKNLITYSIFLLLGITMLSSCAKRGIAYTNEIQDKYQLSTDDLTQIQFYLSADITLKKSSHSGEAKRFNKRGQLIISSSSSVETIFIDKDTPGICIKAYNTSKVAVSFFDDPDKVLFFGDMDGNGKYRLLAKEWKDGKGLIEFGNDIYYIQPGSSSAFLEFRMAKVKSSESVMEVAKGKKVNN